MPTGGDNGWKEWGRHVLATLEKLTQSVEQVDQKQDEHNATLVRNTATLEEHVRRTDLLEAKVEKISKIHERELQQHTQDIGWLKSGAKLILLAALGALSWSLKYIFDLIGN